MNVAATVPQREANPQLSLPTGPFTSFRGGRRDRKDEDRDFLSAVFKVKAGGVSSTALYRCLGYYASLTERRIAYPSQSTMATYCDMSVRQVRRVLRKLERGGVIVCLERKQGRCSSTYVLAQTGQNVPFKPDILSEEEGIRDKRTKDPSLSVNDDAQTIDPGAVEEVEIPEEVICLPFPSQEQEQKANAPVPEETVFVNDNQVKLLFKLQRKLGYRADDEQARVFDALEHADRKRILDKLLEEEQLAAAQGKVTAPPKASPSPRHEFPLPVARNKVRQRPTCETHRWTPPASDGVLNCYDCDEERMRESQ